MPNVNSSAVSNSEGIYARPIGAVARDAVPCYTAQADYGESLCQILQSISSEEEAIAHVIRAESGKAWWLVGAVNGECGEPLTAEEFLLLNKQTLETMSGLKEIERLLRDKTWMALAMKHCGCAAFKE